MVPVGEFEELDQEIENWLGKESSLKRIGVYADGSCLFHAIFELLDQDYYNSKKEEKQGLGHKKRIKIGKDFTPELFKEIGANKHSKAKLTFEEMKERMKVKKKMKTFFHSQTHNL